MIVEQRGEKLKKRLAIDPVEAEVVRLMFRLFREGSGESGPMGVKAVVSWLNDHGYRTRVGARWGIGTVHSMLTRTTYMGVHRFNRFDWKTKQPKPESEVVQYAVDAIVELHEFDAVQRALKARNSRNTPPRVVTGPILLTGLATCATCGGGMTLRTGKYGRYRYYTCASAAQKGKSACKGRSIPMAKLDEAVTERLSSQLLTHERMGRLLEGLLKRQTERSDDHASRATALRNKCAEAETRLKRMYSAIENGLLDTSDPTLKERIAEIRSERDMAAQTLERVMSELSPENKLTEEKIAAFLELMRKNVLEGEIGFRRAYLRSVIDQVEVDDDEVRIYGRKSVLEQLVSSGQAGASSVPSFVRKWRTRLDSNQRPLPSEDSASIW